MEPYAGKNAARFMDGSYVGAKYSRTRLEPGETRR